MCWKAALGLSQKSYCPVATLTTYRHQKKKWYSKKDGSFLDRSLANRFRFRKQWNSELKLQPEGVEGEMLYITLYVADAENQVLIRQTIQPILGSRVSSVSH